MIETPGWIGSFSVFREVTHFPAVEPILNPQRRVLTYA